MAIDFSPLSRIKSVGDFDNERLSRQANQLALLTQQQKADEYSRSVEDANALRQIQQELAGTAPEAYGQALRQRGRFNEGMAADKAYFESQKAKVGVAKDQNEIEKNNLQMARDKLAMLGNVLGAAKDPAGYAQGLQALQAQGIDVSKVPQQFDPQYVANAAQQVLTEQQRIEQVWKQKGYDLDLRKQGEVEANNLRTDQRVRSEGAANRGVQLRGQNLADARARETVSATMGKPFEVTGPDGLPVLVRQDKAGNITPVEGYGPKTGASKPLNDTQAKALLFGTRMQEANKALESLDGKYSPAAVNAKTSAEGMPLIGGLAGMAGNALLSEAGQQAEQAQRDFINAVLRRESGAVISDQEFANAKKQYFPQPNDKPATLEQKKRNRQLAIDGLLAEVPEGRRASITPKAAPNIDSLLDKYK